MRTFTSHSCSIPCADPLHTVVFSEKVDPCTAVRATMRWSTVSRRPMRVNSATHQMSIALSSEELHTVSSTAMRLQIGVLCGLEELRIEKEEVL